MSRTKANAQPLHRNNLGTRANRIERIARTVAHAQRHLERKLSVADLASVAGVSKFREWLPSSGEAMGEFPMFFHYVNVGPQIPDHEMITDVYLPLKNGS